MPHLAQLNVARALHPLDDPRMEGFTRQLDAINALAEASPGFVWRLKTDAGDATDIRVEGDPRLIVNMSVWTSIEALRGYVFKSAHGGVMKQRRTWFEAMDTPSLVMWWVEPGTVPTLSEGLDRLAELARSGPSARGFTFRAVVAPPDGEGP
ncbi:MAG: DUF3291 domain-containing protein [Alphaproteobacteria bacterium]|nr:DUF3291 domain-containing protein [Alphaproteobacteria bacterium]